MNGHYDKPALRLSEGVGRVFRNEDIIARRDVPRRAAFDPGSRQVGRVRPLFADQLSAKQQSALVAYVKDGGAVLFITPDSDATGKFAGTPL